MPERPAPRPLRHDPLVWVLGCLVAIAVVVLASAEFAALAFGAHRTLPLVTAGAIGHALVRLPRRLGDPRLAWPLPDQTALPGPVGYWGSVALCVVTLVGTAALAGRTLHIDALSGLAGRFSAPGSARKRRLGADPRARLAGRRDVAPLIVDGPKQGRIILGRLGAKRGPLLATEDEGVGAVLSSAPQRMRGGRASVIVLGPTRSGKTAGLAIPAILEWEGPILALSVKDDVMRATLARRRERGEVKVFDPRGVSGVPTATWSPLGRSETFSGALRAARSLGGTAPGSGRAEGQFWAAAAEDIVAPALYVAATAPGRGMADVVRWVSTQDSLGGSTGEMEEALVTQLSTDPVRRADAQQALHALEVPRRTADATRGSITLSARNAVKPWADPEVATSAVSCEITPDWLWNGDNTCYVCAPAHQQQELVPVFLGLVTEVLDRAYEVAQAAGGNLPRRLLVVVDEAANLCPLPDLPRYASTAAGIGVQLVTVFQDLAQVRTRYGDAAPTVVNNHVAKVVLSGISDTDTLGLVSQLLGEEEYRQASRQTDSSGRESVSESIQVRRLAPLDLVRRVAPGQGVLVYGALLPAHLVLRPWYAEPGLRHNSTAKYQTADLPTYTTEKDSTNFTQGATP